MQSGILFLFIGVVYPFYAPFKLDLVKTQFYLNGEREYLLRLRFVWRQSELRFSVRQLRLAHFLFYGGIGMDEIAVAVGLSIFVVIGVIYWIFDAKRNKKFQITQESLKDIISLNGDTLHVKEQNEAFSSFLKMKRHEVSEYQRDAVKVHVGAATVGGFTTGGAYTTGGGISKTSYGDGRVELIYRHVRKPKENEKGIFIDESKVKNIALSDELAEKARNSEIKEYLHGNTIRIVEDVRISNYVAQLMASGQNLAAASQLSLEQSAGYPTQEKCQKIIDWLCGGSTTTSKKATENTHYIASGVFFLLAILSLTSGRLNLYSVLAAVGYALVSVSFIMKKPKLATGGAVVLLLGQVLSYLISRTLFSCIEAGAYLQLLQIALRLVADSLFIALTVNRKKNTGYAAAAVSAIGYLIGIIFWHGSLSLSMLLWIAGLILTGLSY